MCQGPKPAPPQIIEFLQNDLVASDEVKFRDKFKWQLNLPCRATGSNKLSWEWRHNDSIINPNKFEFDDYWQLSQDGTLKAKGLSISDSGTYQCFVTDTVTGVKTFSRKLRVAVTAVGQFNDELPIYVLVNLGQPFDFDCPPHGPSSGVSFTWTSASKKKFKIPFARSERVAIDPSNGALHIMYITPEDIARISDLGGIQCTMSGANTFYSSGALTLKPLQGVPDPAIFRIPSFTSATSNSVEVAVEGKSKVLYCLATARPFPTITWKKNGKELRDGVDFFEIPSQLEGRLLTITKVDVNMHEDIYTCQASNNQTTEIGPQERNISLQVEVAPRWNVEPPKLQTFNISTNGNLSCDVYAEPKPLIKWFRDGSELVASSKVRQVNTDLVFSNLTLDETGIYQCVAENKHGMIVSSTYFQVLERSEDSASATINIAGAPYPPYNLKLSSDCQNRNTTLTWVTGESNQAPITHFLVERKSTHPHDAWQVIANVTKPNATSYALVKMAGNADLAFRGRAVNGFGPSRPSKPTSSVCRTDAAAPDKWPDNFRGIPGKAEQLDIGWTAMRMVEWNAPGLFYKLWYKRVGPANSLVEIKLDDPKTERFNIPNAGYYVQWEFQIQAINDIAPGPKSPFVKAFSGQDPPAGRPEDVTVGTVTARSVELSWKPVTVTRGSVDGYRIYYWGESLVSAKRRRRAIPTFALSTNVKGGGTQSYTVTELKPYTRYTIAVTAYNSRGEGPESAEVKANTLEAEPGPPSIVKIYAFAKYILVSWEPPLEPNGIITKYRIGSNTFTGSQHNDVEITNMQKTKADVREKLLRNMEPETNNVIEIQAMTTIGWGEGVRKTKRTVPWSAPAKPEKPELERTAVNKVRVYYKFGLGGGYTHEFLVMYRKKVVGEKFRNSSWINHFEEKSVEIDRLEPDLYEFKTVARNDFPDEVNPEESPESDIAEGIFSQRTTTPIHQTAWFIALLVLIAVLILILLIFVLYHRYQSAKYPVNLTKPIPFFTCYCVHWFAEKPELDFEESHEMKFMDVEVDEWEISRDRITLEEVIGSGTFGTVWRATLSRKSGKPGIRFVAAKCLNPTSGEEGRKALMREIGLGKALADSPLPNVIEFIGCVTTQIHPILIMEYLHCGDLLGYLRKSRGIVDKYYHGEGEVAQLRTYDLVSFSKQIATAMGFLASRGIIHRDLAARNVLLDKNCECKVTNFGLSYQNFKYGHGNAKKGCTPVKWTAPEILFGDASNLSTKSDVWSYGVVLYEIFTIGGIPYPGWSEAKTIAELQKGYRMPKPPHIADTMYRLMERCWQENPGFRPNFENIRKDLLFLIEKQLYLGLLDESKYDGTKYSMVEDVCAASLMPRPNKKWSSLKFDQSLPPEEPISDSLPSYWI
ncbi:fibronectin type III domain-containing protein-like isoform X4 [Montipora foliosa]|uniref:fibronectin type III domain-containing protein-like isoform X4 n=1 Tax=Montipora foliosa TaxID=591990 RepID=UPI0035F1BC21